MSYDPRCEELAEYFLSDAGEFSLDEKRRLAQTIQDAIEDYLWRNAEGIADRPRSAR